MVQILYIWMEETEKIYFNPFNIGAQVGNDVATALAKAKEEGLG